MDWFITCQTVSPDQRQEVIQSEYRKMHFGDLVKHYVTNGDINEKVYVDDYEFDKYKEGDFYKE